MVTNQIRFDDGAAYEQYMGKWSQLAGETFLDRLAPKLPTSVDARVQSTGFSRVVKAAKDSTGV